MSTTRPEFIKPKCVVASLEQAAAILRNNVDYAYSKVQESLLNDDDAVYREALHYYEVHANNFSRFATFISSIEE